MKITKRQLRRIIREEKSRLLKENPAPRSVEAEHLATLGADAALRMVQKRLDITSGDLAAQWDGWDDLVRVLMDYINFENKHSQGWDD
tara:strand:- start:2446 stop:2709 length:264 start_codon:yes stop_codon:yes gene_type:complete